jgi:hypothetical protein
MVVPLGDPVTLIGVSLLLMLVGWRLATSPHTEPAA